jgi:endonuclease-3
MNRVNRIAFFSRLQELNPNPKTELLFDSNYELLVAVMLSAQSTDIGVNKVTRRLFPLANSPQAMVNLGLAKIRKTISSLGLYNAKAANVFETSRLLVEQHQGLVPSNRTALEALPGVGRKTANVVLNTAFRQPVMAVDTHIFRLANRTGLAPGKSVREVEETLIKNIPKPFLLDAHHWLILHGRYVCKARKPDCPNCIVRDLCRFKDKTG